MGPACWLVYRGGSLRRRPRHFGGDVNACAVRYIQSVASLPAFLVGANSTLPGLSQTHKQPGAPPGSAYFRSSDSSHLKQVGLLSVLSRSSSSILLPHPHNAVQCSAVTVRLRQNFLGCALVSPQAITMPCCLGSSCWSLSQRLPTLIAEQSHALSAVPLRRKRTNQHDILSSIKVYPLRP